jgi:hypothetical protein
MTPHHPPVTPQGTRFAGRHRPEGDRHRGVPTTRATKSPAPTAPPPRHHKTPRFAAAAGPRGRWETARGALIGRWVHGRSFTAQGAKATGTAKPHHTSHELTYADETTPAGGHHHEAPRAEG